jgi:hypothetical protein
VCIVISLQGFRENALNHENLKSLYRFVQKATHFIFSISLRIRQTFAALSPCSLLVLYITSNQHSF